MYNMMTIPNTGGMVYLKVKTVNPKSSQHKEKKNIFLILYLNGIMVVN